MLSNAVQWATSVDWLTIDDESGIVGPGESEEINKSDATHKKPSRIKRFITDLSRRNKGQEMAKIKVKFHGQDAPEGIARIKDSLVKIIPN